MVEVYGDDTVDTRRMMMQMEVKSTPTFRLYRKGQLVDVLTGTNDKKLMRAMIEHLTPEELSKHADEVAELQLEADAQQQAAVSKS